MFDEQRSRQICIGWRGDLIWEINMFRGYAPDSCFGERALAVASRFIGSPLNAQHLLGKFDWFSSLENFAGN